MLAILLRFVAPCAFLQDLSYLYSIVLYSIVLCVYSALAWVAEADAKNIEILRISEHLTVFDFIQYCCILLNSRCQPHKNGSSFMN